MSEAETRVPGAVGRFDRDTLFAHERAALDDAFARLAGTAPVRVLDLGCGRGRTTAVIAAMANVEITALDIDEAIVADARRVHPEIAFAVGDATRLDGFADAAFDLVLFSFNGIDYIDTRAGRRACLAEVARVLRPGGVFVHSSHNRRALWANRDARRILKRNLWRLLTGADLLRERGRLWDLECWHGTPASEKDLLAEAGLELVRVFSRARAGVAEGVAATTREHWPYYVSVRD